MHELERALKPVKRRMRTQRTFVWAMYGLFAAAVCIVLLRAASFLWVFPAAALLAAVVLAAIPALFAIISWLWPITAMDAARQADALGLKARAQTAVMLHGCDTAMARLQRQDALSSLADLEPDRYMTLRPPKLAWIGMLACLGVLGISFLVPNPQAQALKEREQFRARMEEQAQKVDDGAASLDASAAETPELRRLLGELSQELRHAEGARDALSAVDTTERKVGELQSRTARDALSAMKSAGLDALAKALEAGDGQTVQAELEALAGAENALSQAAAKAATGTAAQQLDNAAKAMGGGNAQQALSALQSVASGQTAASAQAMALAGMVRSAAARAGAQGANAAMGQGAQNGVGSQPGGGKPGAGAGLGTSNKDGGANAAQPGAAGRGTAGPEKKTAEYEAIYDPTRLGGAGDTHNERGQMGQGEIVEAEAGTGAGSLEGSVPYRQALPEYRQSAVEAAQSADLPAYVQKWVETYFNALAQ